MLREKLAALDISKIEDFNKFKNLAANLKFICGALSEANCKTVKDSANAAKQKGTDFDYKKELELVTIE